MMRKKYGLRMLYVRVTGQADMLRICFCGTCLERVDKFENFRTNHCDFALAPQTNRSCHLIVAASTRVDSTTRFAGNLSDPAFNGGVNVLIGRLEHERVGSEFMGDGVEGCQHVVTIDL